MPTVLIIALAGILSFGSAWLIAAESFRPSLGHFPKGAAEAPSFAAALSSAGLAASVGWPRGDLASENAVVVYADAMARGDGQSSKQTSLAAVHVAPYDARPWLTLAAQEEDPRRRQQLLNMSYYTAPTSAYLFPQRFRLAAMQQPIDEELRTLLEFEVGILLKQGDGFEADLEKIYRATPDRERSVLERLLNAADPSVLAKLKNRTR